MYLVQYLILSGLHQVCPVTDASITRIWLYNDLMSFIQAYVHAFQLSTVFDEIKLRLNPSEYF